MAEEYDKQQYDTLKYVNEKFDKNVILIATGALTISMAFLKDIVGDPDNIKCKELIIKAWTLFAVTIFIALVASFISILANRWAIKNDPCEGDTKKYDAGVMAWNWTIRIMYIAKIILLLIGLIMMINFVKLNMQ